MRLARGVAAQWRAATGWVLIGRPLYTLALRLSSPPPPSHAIRRRFITVREFVWVLWRPTHPPARPHDSTQAPPDVIRTQSKLSTAWWWREFGWTFATSPRSGTVVPHYKNYDEKKKADFVRRIWFVLPHKSQSLRKSDNGLNSQLIPL